MKTARQIVKQMTPAQRLAAHRRKAALQERAAVDLGRIIATARQEIELDGIERLVDTAVGHGAITPGRAAGLRGASRRDPRLPAADCQAEGGLTHAGQTTTHRG
jgi:hypothetical protein